jgi:MFS family permease
MPNFVPQPLLTSANALVGFTSSLAVMIGFPLGGWIVQEFGIRWGFATNALSFAFCGALVAGTTFPTGLRVATKSLVTDLADGFRYVRGNRTVRSVIIVVGLITLAAGAKSPLESLFALQALNAGTMGLGLLGAVWGAGMIIGTVFAARLDRRVGHARMLTGSVGLVAVVVILASLSPVLAPVAILWVAGGMGNTTGTVAYETLLQERTEDAVRGRVMAALEASVQAGLLAGVALAALSDTLFRHGDVARSGLAMAGGLFGVAALASWWLVQRPADAAWEVRDLEVVPVGERYALVRITAEGPEAATAPVLVVDEGGRPRRLAALHGGVTLPSGRRRYGYGVPRSALGGLALDTGGGRPIQLSLP